MFMMVEEGIRGGMCQAIYRYAKAKKFIKIKRLYKNYDENSKKGYFLEVDVELSKTIV